MRIRSLISFAGIAAIVAIILAAIAMHYFSFRDLSDTYRHSISVTEIGKASSDLSILTGEYLLYRGTRAQRQWLNKHQSLGRRLASYDDGNGLKGSDIDRLRKQHIELTEVFSMLVDVSTPTDFLRKSTTGSYSPLEARIATRLLTSLHTMVAVSSGMVNRFTKEMEEAIFRSLAIFFFAFLALILVFFWGWLLIVHRISRPVTLLSQGIDKLSAGDLNYHIPKLYQDEVGVVVDRVNAMAKNLKEIMVSRDQLEDIVEEKITNLRESEDRFQHAVSSISDIVYVARAEDLSITYVNAAIEHSLGFTPQEWLGDPFIWIKQIYQDDRDRVLKAVKSGVAQREPFTLEYRLWHKDSKQLRWFEHRVSVERDDQTGANILYGSMTDITDRKLAEKALNERTHDLGERVKEMKGLYLLSDILNQIGLSLEEAMSLAVLVIPPAWHYPEITCARITIGKLEFSTKNFRETSWRQASVIVAEGAPAGKIEVYYLERTPELDEGPFIKEERELIDQIAVRLGNHIDRRQVEANLKASEQYIRAIAESSRDAIVAIDEDGQVISWNRGAEGLFGYTLSEMLGNTLDVIIPEVHRNKHRRAIKQLSEDKTRQLSGEVIEIEAVRKDGSIFCCDLSLGTWEASNRRFFSGIIRDITERKAKDAQLNQAGKMATLGEMSTGIAHELNQPLNIISMAAQSGQEHLEEGKLDKDFLVAKFSRVRKQIERAVGITSHMRIFGRISPSEAELYDPCDVVESALGLLGQQLTLHNIEVTKEFSEDHHADVMGYDSLLEQVLVNLLTNARDAIEAHREIENQTGHVVIRVADDENDNVEISVTDDGGGISADNRDKIFEPFFTSKSVGSGTGLGLSISYGIVKDMKGEISARNVDGGAEFMVQIPKQVRQAVAAATNEGAGSRVA